MVSFFFSFIPFFDCGPVFRGDIQPIEKNLLDFQMQNVMLKLLKKKFFNNTHYSSSLQDPENCSCVLVQFEIFEQILGTKEDSKNKKRFENSICFTFHLSTYYYMYPKCQNSKKKKKMYACKAAVGGPFLEMALHYHRVYQISSLEANLSLEGLKQPCRQTQPKNNNLAWFLLTMIKNNSKHTLIFPETPVTSTLSDVAEVEPVYIVSPYLVLVCWLLILSILLALPIYIFLSLNNLKLFFKTS